MSLSLPHMTTLSLLCRRAREGLDHPPPRVLIAEEVVGNGSEEKEEVVLEVVGKEEDDEEEEEEEEEEEGGCDGGAERGMCVCSQSTIFSSPSPGCRAPDM